MEVYYETLLKKLKKDMAWVQVDSFIASKDQYFTIEKAYILPFAKALKQKTFLYLVDITAIDHCEEKNRFELVYNVVSFQDNKRLFIQTFCDEKDVNISSVTGVWQGANWLEREVYDMFGICFDKHPDMRRIFMPEDFKYYPLRKEFPLLGIPGSMDLPNAKSE